MINILIVENKKASKQLLSESIVGDYNVLKTISKGKDAIEFIEQNSNIDIVIIGIDLEDNYSGFDVAKSLKNNTKPSIIFYTPVADSVFIEKTEVYNPVTYMINPSKKEQIEITLKLAVKSLKLTQHNKLKDKSISDSSLALKKITQLYDKPIILLEKSKIIDCNYSFLNFIDKSEKESNIGRYFYELLPDYQSDGAHSVVYFEKQLLLFETQLQANFDLLIKKTDALNEQFSVEMILLDDKSEKYILILNSLDDFPDKDRAELVEMKKVSKIYNSVQLAILLIDSPSYKIVDANAYALRFFNQTKSELKQMNLSNIFPDEYIKEIGTFNSSKKHVTTKVNIGKNEVYTTLTRIEFLNEQFILMGIMPVQSRAKKTNAEIDKSTRENAEVEKLQAEHQKLSESLIYAKRIQAALMPSKEYLAKYFNEYFIYWQPKEIVSGDFYWANYKNGHMFFALGDATGQGVPAAFMSILGMSYLNEITIDLEKGKASQVLDILRGKLVKSLNKKSDIGEIQDGFNMSLLIINQEKMRMQFASANMSILMIRNNQIVEIVGDSMPIGMHSKSNISFTNHKFRLEKGDKIYMFSGSILQQPSGKENQKLGNSEFKKVLLSIQHLSMNEQEESLNKFCNSWVKEQEQIDDVLVVGMCV